MNINEIKIYILRHKVAVAGLRLISGPKERKTRKRPNGIESKPKTERNIPLGPELRPRPERSSQVLLSPLLPSFLTVLLLRSRLENKCTTHTRTSTHQFVVFSFN